MIRQIHQRLRDYQDSLSARFGSDISTPEARRAAKLHFHLSDHAFLRLLWSNFDRFAPGAYRANQPSPAQLARYKALGITTVINLRGEASQSFWLFEAEACAALGLTLKNINLSARRLPSREALLELHDMLADAEKPFLIHCKSGSDRTGMVAALYLIWFCDTPLELATKQLSFRYLHLDHGSTGILDHFFRFYARANAASPIGLLDWIKSAYDPAEVTESYRRWQTNNKADPW
ncbi:MAG: fused DSP-PTPase phosphatase/NAD kinase-like protein [Paracoccaceae bacterium]